MHYPLAQQGFALAVDVGQGIPPVLSDPDAIEQAILNLLANALKYSADARKIELILRREEAHAVTWLVRARRGQGILRANVLLRERSCRVTESASSDPYGNAHQAMLERD